MNVICILTFLIIIFTAGCASQKDEQRNLTVEEIKILNVKYSSLNEEYKLI